MKKFRLGMTLIGTAAIITGLPGCADESPWGSASDEKGSIELSLTTDYNFDTAKPVVRSDEDTRAGSNLSDFEGISLPKLKDFSIKLEKNDNSYSNIWSSYADFQTEAAKNQFPVGLYTITASYGTKGEQGINKPYFEGSASFNILAGHTRQVSLTAELKNSMVQIVYSDRFKEYMTEYFTSLSTKGKSDEIKFAQGETGIAFIEAEETTLYASFTTAVTNKKAENLEVGKFVATAKTLHKVNLDVNPNPNGATLNITFDETVTDGDDVEIDLTKDLYTKPAPTITPSEFTDGQTINMYGADANNANIKMDVVAPYGIKAAELTVEGINGYTYNEVINLVSTTLPSGIVATGFPTSVQTFGEGEQPKKVLASLDLSQYARNLCTSEEVKEYKLSLKVTDFNDKSSNIVSVILNSREISLQRIAPSESSTSEVQFGSDKATLKMSYNGAAPENVVFKDNNNNELPIEKITHNGETVYTRAYETKIYEYTLRLPAATTSSSINISAFDKNSNAELGTFNNIPVEAPKFEVSDVDAYTSYAYLQLKVTLPDGTYAADNSETLKTVTKDVQLANGSYNGAVLSIHDASKGQLKVTGLKAGESDVNLNLSLKNWPSAPSVSKSFATEKAEGVPNGDFEDLDIFIEDKTINQGGKWGTTILAANYQTTQTMTIKEPKKWISSNNNTCHFNQTYSNSWYDVPSVYNTKPKYQTNWPKTVAQKEQSVTADIYNIEGYNGTSMVVRNVAWDANGKELSDDKKTGDPSPYNNYYCSNEPSISNRSRGFLKLGSDGNGYSFSSRPKKLKGYYMYKDSQDSSESGLITVKLLNGTTEIATGSINLGAKDNYTSFEIPLDYKNKAAFAPKATKLQIEIYSSNKTSDIKTKNYCNKEECCSRGAALYVDDLTFEY